MPKEEREEITVKELAMSNAYQLEALTELLEEDGVITKERILERL